MRTESPRHAKPPQYAGAPRPGRAPARASPQQARRRRATGVELRWETSSPRGTTAMPAASPTTPPAARPRRPCCPGSPARRASPSGPRAASSSPGAPWPTSPRSRRRERAPDAVPLHARRRGARRLAVLGRPQVALPDLLVRRGARARPQAPARHLQRASRVPAGPGGRRRRQPVGPRFGAEAPRARPQAVVHAPGDGLRRPGVRRGARLHARPLGRGRMPPEPRYRDRLARPDGHGELPLRARRVPGRRGPQPSSPCAFTQAAARMSSTRSPVRSARSAARTAAVWQIIAGSHSSPRMGSGAI